MWKRWLAVLVGGTVVLAIAYAVVRGLGLAGVRSGLVIAVILATGAVAARWALEPGPLAVALRDLGLRRPAAGAIIFGAVAVGMGGAFLAFRHAPSLPALAPLLVVGVAEPIAEEALFRGLIFGQMRRASCPLWAALLISAVWFGGAHLIFAGKLDWPFFAVTAVGGLFYAWLFERWGANLYACIGAHAGMNITWSFFESGALGSRAGNLARLAALAAAVLVTTLWAAAGRDPASPAGR